MSQPGRTPDEPWLRDAARSGGAGWRPAARSEADGAAYRNVVARTVPVPPTPNFVTRPRAGRRSGGPRLAGPARPAWTLLTDDEEQHRPLYARVLGLRFVNPGGVLCFLFFEGAVALAVLLALAELVTWWSVVILPAAVAVMVKLNDHVAASVTRSAARVPEEERDRFRRQLAPAVGRASVRPQLRADRDHLRADRDRP